MHDEAWQATGPDPRPRRRRPEWMTQLVLPVAVAVLGTLLVTALTPIGELVRELLFQTRAAVSGSVLLEGVPAGDARLKLDGADAGSADGDGRFLLAAVGDGEHRLRVEAVGAKSRDWDFAVDRGETKMEAGRIDLQPLVRLGYTASVEPPRPGASPFAAEVSYDVTLWIRGDLAVLTRIKSVLYTLPAPLPTTPVAGAAAGQAFCYRQAGAVSFQELFVLGGAFAAATAVVNLGDGQPFQVAAPPGESRPPNCPVHRTSGGAPGQGGGTPQHQPPQGPIKITPPSSPPPVLPVTTVTVPDVRQMTADQAERVLAGLGLTVRIVRQSSADLPAGKVIGTEPAAGARLRKGSTIKLLLSTGPAQRQLDCSPSGGSGVDVSINRGTELRFLNTSSVTMKVVFDGGALPGSPSAIDPGGSFARTFAEAGTYGYKCYFESDGEQTGKITVQGG